MKAISPVITMTLLLLLVIGMVGGYTMYVGGIQDKIINQYEADVIYPVNPPQTMGIICYPGYGFIDVLNTSVGGIVGTLNYFVKVGTTALTGQRTVNFTNYGRIYFGLPSDVGGRVKFELYTPEWKIDDFCTVREDSTLKLYLPFDESSGTTTRDESKYNNDGTLSGYVTDGILSSVNDGTITDATRVEGYIGKALHFDGTADYVTVSSDADILEGVVNQMTLTLWIKPTTASMTDWKRIVEKDLNGFSLTFDNSPKLQWQLGNSTDYQSFDSISNVIPDVWTHIAVNYNSSDGVAKMYINGAYENQMTYALNKVDTSTNDLYFGSKLGCCNFYTGLMDEVKIFDKVLNSTELLQLYQGQNVSRGLIGNWNFDTGRGGTAYDSHLWVNGKYGNALNLNGVSNQLIVPHSTEFENLGNFSVNLWFRYDGRGPYTKVYHTLFNKNAIGFGYLDPFHLWVSNATQALQARVGNGTYGYEIGCSGSVTDGQFHQASLTYNNDTKRYALYLDGSFCVEKIIALGKWIPAQNSDDISIGVWDLYNNNFNGLIDDVRFYRRTLNSTEIGNLYQGVNVDENLVGYWRLDETSGLTAVDSHMWTTGISGTAMNFDGLNDFVNIGSSSSLKAYTPTISAWFKTTSPKENMMIYRWRLYGLAARLNWNSTYLGKLAFGFNDAAADYYYVVSTQNYTDGSWHHMAASFNGTSLNLYLDGLEVSSSTTTANIYYGSGGASVGRDGDYNGSFFEGSVDDVRLYGKALSSDAIYALYDTYR